MLALALSQALALFWFAAALRLRAEPNLIVWNDQAVVFSQGWANLATPYRIPGFVYPPWAALFFAPFNLLPLPLSVLAQLSLYFALLTLLIFRFGGGVSSVLIALTSFLGLNSALELNIDWIVCLGLLAPAALGGPLLVVKPQTALGAWLGLRPRQIIRAGAAVLAVALLAAVVWPGWPAEMWRAIQTYTLGRFYNLAPQAHLPWFVCALIGGGLGWLAYRRRDPALGVLAWVWFVPYVTLYTLQLHLALIAARWRALALALSLGLWLVALAYGRPLVEPLWR